MGTEPREVEFEVLPARGKEGDQTLSGILAWILDDLFPVPGTNYRIGLDPILGLIPGLGDTSTTAVSSLILIESFRRGVPRIVLVRMAVNILINGLGGAIPGVGDVFSAWFKSNRRNYDLLKKHAGTSRASTTGDWIFLGSILAVLLVALAGIAFASAYLLYKLLSLLFG